MRGWVGAAGTRTADGSRHRVCSTPPAVAAAHDARSCRGQCQVVHDSWSRARRYIDYCDAPSSPSHHEVLAGCRSPPLSNEARSSPLCWGGDGGRRPEGWAGARRYSATCCVAGWRRRHGAPDRHPHVRRRLDARLLLEGDGPAAIKGSAAVSSRRRSGMLTRAFRIGAVEAGSLRPTRACGAGPGTTRRQPLALSVAAR